VTAANAQGQQATASVHVCFDGVGP
jgi:hypothetical protein